MAFGEECSREDEAQAATLDDYARKYISTVSFLDIGQEFVGTQNVSSATACLSTRPCAGEAWQLTVRIQGTDFKRGYLCGVMEALNVPSANSSVITFWEGEVVDNHNHSFFTGKWEAKRLCRKMELAQ